MSNTKAIKVLSEVLANSYVLLLKKQNYHWNVKGPNFLSLHQLFELQYTEQFAAIDIIAERIKAIGGHTIGSFSEYAELSKIKEERTAGISSQQMLKNLVLDENSMITVLSAARKTLEDEGDQLSADVLVERTEVHQKNLWMLESSLEQ